MSAHSAGAPVPLAHRFTRHNPCPICGGGDDLPRHRGTRCTGFLSTDVKYAHCSREELAGGLPVEGAGTYAHRLEGPCRCGVTHGAAPTPPPPPPPRRVTEIHFKDAEAGSPWPYRDETGKILYLKVRHSGKRFAFYHPNGDGTWSDGRGGTPSVLLDLPMLRDWIEKADKPILLLEGEKKAHEARALGFHATTNDTGASGFSDDDAVCLRGAVEVVVMLDNDPAGRERGRRVPPMLHAVGVGTVRVLMLPGLAEGEGLDDWLAARKGTGRTMKDVRAELVAEVRKAPRWTPTAEAATPPLPETPGRGVETEPPRVAEKSEVSSPRAPTKAANAWPGPPAMEAFYGLAGEWVRMLDPHTEADRVAVLIQFLVAFGSALNRGPHCVVESDVHACNLFAVLVGESAKARKGTSWGHVRRLFRIVDETWATRRIATGLSSGEGLIWAVRDPIEKQQPIRDRGKITGHETVVSDAGEPDKRLLVMESEFSSPIKVMGREGNTLSPIIRAAWDTDSLRSLTKNSPATATGAHISIIGHIGRDELRRELTGNDMANGFGNRILWVCVRRSKALPEGGHLDEGRVAGFATQLSPVLELARQVRRMERDDAARHLWAEAYLDLSEGKPGVLGAVTSRAEAQVTRLSLIYALLDGRTTVELPHLRAALALWDYCYGSAGYIFGQAQAESDVERDRRRLVEVVAGRGGSVTPAELAKDGPRRFRGESEAAELGLMELVKAGAGAWEDAPPGPDGGRPTRRFRLASEGGVETKPTDLPANSEVRFPLHAPTGVELVSDTLAGEPGS